MTYLHASFDKLKKLVKPSLFSEIIMAMIKV